jgi:transposase-like protein
MSNASPFKWRHFEAEIILLCVRWYLRYALSYRDLEEMLRERGLHVDHTTIYRSRTTLCTRTGETLPPPSQNHHERLVACR